MSTDFALSYAFTTHRNERDKAGDPLLFHVLRVVYAVEKFGEDHVQAALLHDVVESSCDKADDTIAKIRANVLPPVANAVVLLTRQDGEKYSHYIQQIANGNNDIALRVKVADLRDHIHSNSGEILRESHVRRYNDSLHILLMEVSRRGISLR